MFRRAEKINIPAKLALSAVTGGGKTFTALAFATYLAHLEGKPVAVLDSEHGRAQLYADRFEFDTVTPDQFPQPYLHTPENYCAIIEQAIRDGYGVLVIDSLSHEWIGRGGILEIVDQAKRKVRNDMQAWAEATPRHQRLLDTIVHAPIHIICTMRSKTDWIMESNDRGKQIPRRAGMAPQQRDGVEFEFDLILDLTTDGDAVVTKTRCPQLRGCIEALPKDGGVGFLPIIETFASWLGEGAPGDDTALMPPTMTMDTTFRFTGSQDQLDDEDEAAEFDAYRPSHLSPPAAPSRSSGAAATRPSGPATPRDQVARGLLPQGRANGNGQSTGDAPVRCSARVQGVPCDEVIDPTEDYIVDDYKCKGKVLIARSRERVGKVFCPTHYIVVRDMKDKAEQELVAVEAATKAAEESADDDDDSEASD